MNMGARAPCSNVEPPLDVCYGSYHILLGLSDILNFRLNVEVCIVGEAVDHDAVSSSCSSAA